MHNFHPNRVHSCIVCRLHIDSATFRRNEVDNAFQMQFTGTRQRIWTRIEVTIVYRRFFLPAQGDLHFHHVTDCLRDPDKRTARANSVHCDRCAKTAAAARLNAALPARSSLFCISDAHRAATELFRPTIRLSQVRGNWFCPYVRKNCGPVAQPWIAPTINKANGKASFLMAQSTRNAEVEFQR